MRLVNREQADVPSQHVIEKAGQHEPLRRDVEQAELAVVQPTQPRTRLARRERRIQKRGRHARRLQRIHLVLHQRDERRDNNRQPRTHQRRQLETERLPTAGGHEHKHITSR